MADLKKHSIADLQKELATKRAALMAFRFGEAGSRTRNVKEGRTVRRDIARILTEMNARKLAEPAKNA